MTRMNDPRSLALLLAATLTVMANATISPALPMLADQFADNPHSDDLTRLLVTAPSLMVALAAPFAGLGVDRMGRRRTLLAGVVLYSLAGTAGLYLPTLEWLLISRLALGVGVALVMTAQSALIGDYFTGEARGRFMGYQAAATNFSGFAFLAIAGIVASASARYPFAIYGIALLYLPFIVRAVSEPTAASAPEDHGVEGASSWIYQLAVLCGLAFMTMVTFYVMPTQFPFYLRQTGQASPATAGFLLGLLTLAGGFAALAFGRVRAALGQAATPALGSVLMAAGFFVLWGATGRFGFAVGAALIGSGFAFIIPAVVAWTLDIAPMRRRGLASGCATTVIFLGQFVSPLFSQRIIDQWDFRSLFLGSVILLTAQAGLLAALSFRSKKRLRANEWSLK